MTRRRKPKRTHMAESGQVSADDLPDTSKWVPRQKAAATLAVAFAKRCASGEESLRRALAHEREMAVDNFDSGLPFEVAVREEIGRLLPERYTVTSGVVVDRSGMTSGQCDVVIFNHHWFTAVNAPTVSGTRLLIPVEGVYAIGEVKQTLTAATLDDAMEKLVVAQRLQRPPTFAHRLVENRESDDCPHGLTNPLFTFVLAGGAAGDLQSLIRRFFDVNSRLRRLELVRCLCILGVGTVSWVFYDPLHDGEVRPALFMEDDLFHPIVPAFMPAEQTSALYALAQSLHLHLFHSVLAPEDIASAYGFGASADQRVKLPVDPTVALKADDEWVQRLAVPCNHRKAARNP